MAHNKLENFSRNENTRSPSLRNLYAGQKQQLEPCMEQLTGSKLEKEYVKAVCCQSYLFNLYLEYIMRNARLHESQAGIKIVCRDINNFRYADDTDSMNKHLSNF